MLNPAFRIFPLTGMEVTPWHQDTTEAGQYGFAERTDRRELRVYDLSRSSEDSTAPKAKLPKPGTNGPGGI